MKASSNKNKVSVKQDTTGSDCFRYCDSLIGQLQNIVLEFPTVEDEEFTEEMERLGDLLARRAQA